MSNAAAAEVGSVTVATTQFRGSSPEELADRALEKIIHVGASAHPAIRAQAEAYREDLRAVLVFYLRAAMAARDTTLANTFIEAGHPELIPLLKA